MLALWHALYRDERGFVLSAELIIIATVLVLGLITAFACVQAAVVGELKDVGSAIGSLNQSYCYSGMKGCLSWCGTRSRTYGSAFFDEADSPDELRADFDCCVQSHVACTPQVSPSAACVTPPQASCLPIDSPYVDPWTPGVPSPGVVAGPCEVGALPRGLAPELPCPTSPCEPSAPHACPPAGEPCATDPVILPVPSNCVPPHEPVW
jgi:hypothetical protein